MDLHRAATLPWVINDRTRSAWPHPSDESQEHLADLVEQHTVAGGTVGVERARAGRRVPASTAASEEKDAAAPP
ncbi:hypothetical protein [Streptomyces ziwulingensis]|uniref:Uncharacterized protein n=1 Tax=Streptomyces ziwulingensis TaxID=1045501 RepID=A0ABP9CVI8_9ACTN